MAWVTPVTFISTDKYNADDLNRVEGNSDHIADMLATLNPTGPVLVDLKTDWDNADIPVYDDINRIENNIQILRDYLGYDPITPAWETPVTTWVSVLMSFGYTQANRLENNLLGLKTMIDAINDALIYVGSPQAVCGRGNTWL